jgi:uncharacterized protein YjbJ (UPF0337 family)
VNWSAVGEIVRDEEHGAGAPSGKNAPVPIGGMKRMPRLSPILATILMEHMWAPTLAQAPMLPSAQNLTPVCYYTPYIDTRHRLFDDQESQDEPKLARLSAVSTTSQEFTMNKDQVKGAAKDLGGKIQQEVGKLVGSTEQQAKGLKNQAEGELQEHLGDLKENLKDARDAVKDALKP